ncbi:Anhydro-N-acetylmuramic acid kinase [BD1-7 clade bacterium]|uniref:Anhydro-N-acetylmuramic acid kinase n=1 Tax=BD1-7 clade bacterium TaxID=2029982 RepID=A0A5S9QAN9_9GAMM|nr:Anhydro-N-acetylmuramic acid kinase [BD1-7 clade bacterium]
MENSRDLYVGLMSGTSVDAVDAVLMGLGDHCQLMAKHSHPIDPTLKAEILALNAGCDDELNRSQRLCRQLGNLFADATLALLSKANVDPIDVRAIGSHGQTLRHAPDGHDGFTLQVGDPNTIAERTGITVVADFRRKDIAAGGQGAPLVPAFHQKAFGDNNERRAIINIGGMANITLLDPEHGPIAGFDTGPGNVLLDAWCERHQRQCCDKQGAWAASGQVITLLLEAMLADPYFQRPAPKSCGRETFNLDWLEQFDVAQYDPADVQASLSELTARTITDAIHGQCDHIYLCGGGAFNDDLLARIQRLAGVPVDTTDALGVAPDWLEAMAFAWFANQTLNACQTNVPKATGARGNRILGAIFPAG